MAVHVELLLVLNGTTDHPEMASYSAFAKVPRYSHGGVSDAVMRPLLDHSLPMPKM